MLTDADIFDLWEQALHEQIGIVIVCSSPEELRRRCFTLKKAAIASGEDSFNNLTFSISPIKRDELVIANDKQPESN